MSRFSIYLGDKMIGWSELEFGDPPMGVAFGKFIPNSEYTNDVALAVINTQELATLSAFTNNGVALEASGGVHIEDHSAEFGPEEMEVSVLGIAYPAYESLFPEHVAKYQQQFKSS